MGGVDDEALYFPSDTSPRLDTLMNRSGQIFTWLPAALWMAVIGCLSSDSFSGSWSEALLRSGAAWLHISVTEHGLQLANLILRKTAHFLEFFVLGVLLHRAVAPKTTVTLALCWVILTGGAYALMTESFQALTVTRGPSLLDATVDISGVLGSQWLIGRTACRGRSLFPTSAP